MSDMVCGLAALEDRQAALEVCRKAAEGDPNCEQSLYAVAYYMARCGYPTEFVIPVMHHVVKLAPRELRFRVALGMLQMAAGENDLAYRIMREVSRPQLASLSCTRCLYQFADLFGSRGDEHRRCVCLLRARALREDV